MFGSFLRLSACAAGRIVGCREEFPLIQFRYYRYLSTRKELQGTTGGLRNLLYLKRLTRARGPKFPIKRT